MSEIDYQALRAKAEKATCGVWSLEYGDGRFDGDDALIHREAAGYLPICRIEGAHPESGFDEDFQMEQQANAEFIAAANPATVLALLDELERKQQYIKRRDQENEDIALTVGKLRVELEGKDSKIANLTAERDALREGEMGDARHSNTRAAADIYFQLVEECEIPAGGSLVEYVDDMREKLEAAENNLIDSECHVAELEEALRDKQALLEALDNSLCEILPGTQYMDPPDGGSVTPLEQVRRMVADYQDRIAVLSASHSKLRDTMATIHNTIRMDGGYTPLAAILNAAKRAYEESATAAGIGVKGE